MNLEQMKARLEEILALIEAINAGEQEGDIEALTAEADTLKEEIAAMEAAPESSDGGGSEDEEVPPVQPEESAPDDGEESSNESDEQGDGLDVIDEKEGQKDESSEPELQDEPDDLEQNMQQTSDVEKELELYKAAVMKMVEAKLAELPETLQAKVRSKETPLMMLDSIEEYKEIMNMYATPTEPPPEVDTRTPGGNTDEEINFSTVSAKAANRLY